MSFVRLLNQRIPFCLLLLPLATACDVASNLLKTEKPKERVYRNVINGELFVVPRKYSPKSIFAVDQPDEVKRYTDIFNFSFIYPEMISWGEAKQRGLSMENSTSGMLYRDPPEAGNPYGISAWRLHGYLHFGDRDTVLFKHMHDYLRARAAKPTEIRACLSGGEYDEKLGMTRYVLNDTPEHHPSYYSEIYIEGGNSCTPQEWMKCGVHMCFGVARYREKFAFKYDFEKKNLYEYRQIRTAITRKLDEFLKNGAGENK